MVSTLTTTRPAILLGNRLYELIINIFRNNLGFWGMRLSIFILGKVINLWLFRLGPFKQQNPKLASLLSKVVRIALACCVSFWGSGGCYGCSGVLLTLLRTVTEIYCFFKIGKARDKSVLKQKTSVVEGKNIAWNLWIIFFVPVCSAAAYVT